MNPLSLIRNVTEGIEPPRSAKGPVEANSQAFGQALAQAQTPSEAAELIKSHLASLEDLQEHVELTDGLSEEALAFLKENFPGQELSPEALSALQAVGLLPPPTSPGLKDWSQQPTDQRHAALSIGNEQLPNPNGDLPKPQSPGKIINWSQIIAQPGAANGAMALNPDGLPAQGATPAVTPLAAGLAEAAGKDGRATGTEPLTQTLTQAMAGEQAPPETTRQALKQSQGAPDRPLEQNVLSAESAKPVTAATALVGAGESSALTPANAPATAATGLSTTAATPAPGTSLIMQNAQLESQAWKEELGQHMVRLARLGDQRVSMQLNPAELGPVTVDLKIADKQVHLQLLSGNTVVRNALETALPQLRDSLAEQGMTLGDTQVGDQGTFAQEQQQRGQSSPRSLAYASDEPETLSISTPAIAASSSRIDTYV